jgi:hypothetical protein
MQKTNFVSTGDWFLAIHSCEPNSLTPKYKLFFVNIHRERLQLFVKLLELRISCVLYFYTVFLVLRRPLNCWAQGRKMANMIVLTVTAFILGFAVGKLRNLAGLHPQPKGAAPPPV